MADADVLLTHSWLSHVVASTKTTRITTFKILQLSADAETIIARLIALAVRSFVLE